MKRVLIASMMMVLMAVPAVWGQIPQTMSYQGVLTDGAGTAVPDGNYDLTFRLYTVASGGSAFWTETQNVSVSGGIFNVILGSVTPLTDAFDGQYYLGISVNGGGELSPRRPLTSSPYSLNSQAVAGSENVVPSSGNVGIGTTTPGEKLTVIGVTGTGTGRFVNFERTDNLSIANDMLQISIGAGSSPDCQFIECENGGFVFQVNGDGYVNAAGGLRLGNTTRTGEGSMRWSGSDFEGHNGSSWVSLTSGAGLPAGSAGQTLRHSGAGWVASSLLTNDGSTIGIGTPSLTGELRLYRSGVATHMADVYTGTTGGHLRAFDEAGNWIARMGADVDPTGGCLYIRRNTSSYGFYVEGSWAGAEEPGVGIVGSTRSAMFRMDQSGNASVVLPTDAISASEMLDEPGVASATEGISYITLDGTVQTLLSRSITVPAAGYVLVIGTVQPIIIHTNGTSSFAQFGVSDDPAALPDNQDVTVFIGSAVPTAQYDLPVTPHGLFEVASAGTHTFYLLGYENSGDFDAYDMQLTLIYFATASGTVQPTVATTLAVPDEQAPRRPALSPQEIEAERREAEAFHRARIERELADMQARLDALRQELARELGE